MFDNMCLGCITIRVKGVLVSCIPRFRYSAIYCVGSFLILERARRGHYKWNILPRRGVELEGL